MTHRLAGAVHSDAIHVLDQGCLVESGRHEELLELNGIYAGLWQQQMGLAVRRQLADAAGPMPIGAGPPPGQCPGAGPVGREFAGVARLVGIKEKDASLMTGYLDALSKLRSRLNQLKNQGDPGPGAKQLMQQTLEGSGSELADALKYVDEQMLTGMSDSQKQMLRPLLVRPLVQTFAMIVLPSESEINKTWQAQVVEPFQKNLADKYPFSPGAQMQAAASRDRPGVRPGRRGRQIRRARPWVRWWCAAATCSPAAPGPTSASPWRRRW